MGRVKLLIEKIPNPGKRQNTYIKRSMGLMKKAYELSVLCDVDIGVIMFSPSGKLMPFCMNGTIEQFITRFATTPDYNKPIRTSKKLEKLHQAIWKLNTDRHLEALGGGENSLQEVAELNNFLDQAVRERDFWKEKAKLFPGDESVQKLNSVIQLKALEEQFEQSLVKLRQRKQELAANKDQQQNKLQPNPLLEPMPHPDLEGAFNIFLQEDEELNNIPSMHGVQGQGYCFMNHQVNDLHHDNIMDPMAASGSTMRNASQTRGYSYSMASLCIGAWQADQMPLAAHENQPELQECEEELNVNFSEYAKADAAPQADQMPLAAHENQLECMWQECQEEWIANSDIDHNVNAEAAPQADQMPLAAHENQLECLWHESEEEWNANSDIDQNASAEAAPHADQMPLAAHGNQLEWPESELDWNAIFSHNANVEVTPQAVDQISSTAQGNQLEFQDDWEEWNMDIFQNANAEASGHQEQLEASFGDISQLGFYGGEQQQIAPVPQLNEVTSFGFNSSTLNPAGH
ncbi:hypothetical protein R1flu_005820 [Riccia fluitans]|uniref:MADS-box domain-containing protein n=1 Tax=Riccia fluitans TaxID=41844 RepID=A0ABD1YUU6_9MARC